MNIKQLEFTKESIFEYATRDDVYVVTIQRGRSTKPRPFGLAFKSVKNMTIVDILEALENKRISFSRSNGMESMTRTLSFYANFTTYIMEKQLVLTVKDGSIRHRIDVTGYWFSKTWSP